MQKNNISPQKPKFEMIENVKVISIKNHLKDGVDLDCINILNLIYRTNWTFRRELNKQKMELLRLMQSLKAFYFDYSNEMNTN